MESDCDHSLIEKMKKKFSAPIEHPHDWIQLVRVASKKKPFVVHEMKIEDFFFFLWIAEKTATTSKEIRSRETKS